LDATTCTKLPGKIGFQTLFSARIPPQTLPKLSAKQWFSGAVA
jgi:hypothetical protein